VKNKGRKWKMGPLLLEREAGSNEGRRTDGQVGFRRRRESEAEAPSSSRRWTMPFSPPAPLMFSSKTARPALPGSGGRHPITITTTASVAAAVAKIVSAAAGEGHGTAFLFSHSFLLALMLMSSMCASTLFVGCKTGKRRMRMRTAKMRELDGHTCAVEKPFWMLLD